MNAVIFYSIITVVALAFLIYNMAALHRDTRDVGL